MQNLNRAFPWVGQYLQMAGQDQHLQKSVILSFMTLILLFYSLYLASSLFLGGFFFFYKSIPKGLDESFFGFQAFLEFSVLLFIRTRSSLKWYPLIQNAMILIFLLYVQTVAYGFYYLAFQSLFFFSLALMSYMLYKFEVPAIRWNPSYSYTPSIDRPRTLYFPMFSLNSYNDLPPMWSLFFPLHGR